MTLRKIFCLETSMWDDDVGLPSRTSVLPTLELLERLDFASFIHRTVLHRADFDEYMRIRRTRNRSYGLIYLAFHGSEKGLSVGDDDVSLEELAEAVGTATGAVIHLGSCSVLADRTEEARSLLDRTGARAITGFRRDVEWVECAAFDQILLSYLAWYERPGDAFRFLSDRHGKFAEYMDWTCVD